MNKNPATLSEDMDKLRSAGGDLLYEIAKAFGIIKLIKKVPFLELKDWVKRRDV